MSLIANNILAERLVRLEAAGLITKAPDLEDGRTRLYRLTDKGLDLAPILIELVIWSATHEETAAPHAVVRRMKKDRTALLSDLRREHARRVALMSAAGPAMRREKSGPAAQLGRIGSKPSGRSVTRSR